MAGRRGHSIVNGAVRAPQGQRGGLCKNTGFRVCTSRPFLWLTCLLL